MPLRILVVKRKKKGFHFTCRGEELIWLLTSLALVLESKKVGRGYGRVALGLGQVLLAFFILDSEESQSLGLFSYLHHHAFFCFWDVERFKKDVCLGCVCVAVLLALVS